MATCLWCKKDFFQNRDWQKFCSSKCNDAFRYQQRKREQQRVRYARPVVGNGEALRKVVADIAENKPDFFFKPKSGPSEALVPKREPFKRRV